MEDELSGVPRHTPACDNIEEEARGGVSEAQKKKSPGRRKNIIIIKNSFSWQSVSALKVMPRPPPARLRGALARANRRAAARARAPDQTEFACLGVRSRRRPTPAPAKAPRVLPRE